MQTSLFGICVIAALLAAARAATAIPICTATTFSDIAHVNCTNVIALLEATELIKTTFDWSHLDSLVLLGRGSVIVGANHSLPEQAFVASGITFVSPTHKNELAFSPAREIQHVAIQGCSFIGLRAVLRTTGADIFTENALVDF